MMGAWTADDTAGVLSEPTGSDDKYSRGVLGVRTGSDRYPGAAVLGVEAAWRTGVGMVRYLGPRRAADLVLHRRPETVCADGRVQAWLIGSGTDAAARTSDETAALREILRGDVPVIVDAGALDLVGDTSAPVIVTPHDREHDRLRDVFGLASVDGDRVDAAVETARVAGVVVLLKGAMTVVADPHGEVHRIDVETHRLATAGSGDVLAGVVGALAAAVSTGTPLASVAASGAWLHSRAALLAVRANGGGPVTALDVAASLPAAIGALGPAQA